MTNSGVIPLQRAIDYYFEVAVYLLVLSGFGALAGTGGLDVPTIVLMIVALAVRGYFVAKRQKIVLPESWTTPLSFFYFGFFVVDYAAISRGFLPATVHLALFAVIVRIFSVRRDRDYVTLSILAFLMVLASAVLTVDSIFVFSFAAFMLMAVGTFVLMEMKRSVQGATIYARHSRDPQEHRRFAFALAKFIPALVFFILTAGAALFFVMPRISAGYLGGYAFGTEVSAGFSDHVQLGQIGEIQQSTAVVMHIQIDNDSIGRYDMHWRGVALSDFDGRSWSNPHDQVILQPDLDNGFNVPRSRTTLRSYVMRGGVRENLIHYRVLMEPIGTSVFFLAPWPRRVSGDYRVLTVDAGGAVYNFDAARAISRYEATSDIASAAPAELRSAGRDYPAEVTNRYLRLPAIDPRIAHLAMQITEPAGNDFDKAATIENYLRTRFAYTLELPRAAVKDPLANFLFERKRGHCEYFASSMAVMLRTLGIPSRVVNGFRSDEFNDITGNYVVRAKDAHSWVEAYFPGYGWQTFDPTPAGAVDTPQGWARISLYLDALSSFWRDWIVSYDTSHQYVLTRTAVKTTRDAWQGAREWARHEYAAMLAWAERSQKRVEHSPSRWAVLGTVVALFLLLLANLGRLAKWLHARWLQAYPERSPEQAATLWYLKMTRVLERKGFERSPSQTTQEFLRNIDDLQLQDPVARFTATYESARFGNSGEAAESLPRLYDEVEACIRGR